MRIAYLTSGAAAFLLSVLAACGGSRSASAPQGVAAGVDVEFQNLFDMNGSKVLPTYTSHLVSSTGHPLARVTVRNEGGPIDAIVAVELPRFGDPALQTFSLAEGETRTVDLAPVIDYLPLFQSSTAVPATLVVSVTSGAATLFAQSYPIQITGRNTVFWQNQGASAANLVAAMVTPHDKAQAVAAVIGGAAGRVPAGAPPLTGYQSWSWPSSTSTIPDGAYLDEPLYARAGESLTVAIDSLAGGDGLLVNIYDEAGFAAWVAYEPGPMPCGAGTWVTTATTVQCTAPAAGWYRVVFVNAGASSSAVTVTSHRLMTPGEVAYHQARAIFEETVARGLSYVSLLPGYFTTPREVRYPSESFTIGGGNALEGALLLASVFEAISLEPVLWLSYEDDGAVVAVRCSAGSDDCFVPIQTQAIGPLASFDDAVAQGAAAQAAWASAGHLQQVDVKAARAAGLVPAPW